MSSSIVTNYVEAAIAQLRRLNMMRCPGRLPDAMRDDAIVQSNDWVGWRPIASTVSEDELDALERESGLAMPPLYREFLRYQHFVKLTERGLRFEPHLPGSWGETLRRAYFGNWQRESILAVGLLPVGTESMMDAGQACFDTRRQGLDGDCPVVFWDHDGIVAGNEVRPLFSSVRKMFECLTFVAETDVNFLRASVDAESEAVLLRKHELLAAFLNIDPEGAGGPAREYWTMWAVDSVD